MAALAGTVASVAAEKHASSLVRPGPGDPAHITPRLLEKKDVLHTAQSLFHDHAPAGRAGLARAWIDRRQGQSGGGATMPLAERPTVDFYFPSMAAFVEAHKLLI